MRHCNQCGSAEQDWQHTDDILCPNHAMPEPYSSCDGTLIDDQLPDRINSHAQPQPVKSDLPYIKDLVIQDMKARAEFGYKKYGTFLQDGNNRDALYDAYQESLDLSQYLRLMIFQRDGK